MRYINLKTGAVIDSSFAISGGDWIKDIEFKAQQTGVIENPETPNSEEITQPDKNVVEETIQEEQNSTGQEEITKEQIMQELDAFGIEYNKRDKKQVLYDLMMQHGK
ncbi:hypothetical protein P7H60_06290 [Vagococcus carniphilus]|uniref:hypothetical protein n=1 Tax=Vagococcus carniphilus TaxID=218144 RepID=UPI00288D5F98|nr:hypothetical protein [Vagococcus carniphilus]MDT2848766.1 hypothetical protein [Vagococcus carniphilus]